jgi:type IV pilus assembly protein PilW
LTTVPATATFTVSAFSIRGCEGKFSNITTASNLDALTCTAGTTTLPDSIAVNYEADRYNTIPASGSPTDCLGNTLTTVNATFPSGTVTTATYAVADNRFYIGTSTAIASPSLYCKGNGGASGAQPLVENIEDMQFTYGTVSASNTSTTATIAGYLTANEVVSDANLALLPIEQRWGKVLSVRICVLVRSENPVAPDANSAKYDDCLGNRNVSAPDLRLRRAYSTTVVLRNRRS